MIEMQQKNKESQDYSNIEAIVWDLDNTLYRLDEALEHTFNLAIAKTVISMGVDLELEEASRLAHASFEEFGFSGRVFIKEYGINYEDLHFGFHKYLDEKIVERSLETKDLFSELNLSHVLITHSAKVWAEKVLSHLELSEFFPDTHILPFESYNYESKADSRKSFEMAIELLGFPPDKTVMVEDRVDNLKIPYEMGMKTVFIHHGKERNAAENFVQDSYSDAAQFLQEIKKSKFSDP